MGEPTKEEMLQYMKWGNIGCDHYDPPGDYFPCLDCRARNKKVIEAIRQLIEERHR